MFNLRKELKSLLGAAAGGVGLYHRNFRSRMTVVTFHRVNDKLPQDGLTCGSKKFSAFCAFFRKYFRVVSLEEQVMGSMQGIDMAGTLSITLDDGYLDNFEIAAPILRAYRLPATFFVVTGFIGTSTVPFWDRDLPVQPGWMNWDHLRNLVLQGFSVGSHTDTHINMGTADEGTIRSELLLSKQKLERELGRSVNLFAYPFGGREDISERSIDLVRQAGFISCASCCGGTNDSSADAFHLNRIAIAQWFDTPHQFGAELLLGKV